MIYCNCIIPFAQNFGNQLTCCHPIDLFALQFVILWRKVKRMIHYLWLLWRAVIVLVIDSEKLLFLWYKFFKYNAYTFSVFFFNLSSLFLFSNNTNLESLILMFDAMIYTMSPADQRNLSNYNLYLKTISS